MWWCETTREDEICGRMLCTQWISIRISQVDAQIDRVRVSWCHHVTQLYIPPQHGFSLGGSYETALLELINFVIVYCNRRSVVEHQALTWQVLAWFCGDIKIIAGVRKLKILFNDKSCIKSLLMTKNHHNDVYNTNKNISIYRNY